MAFKIDERAREASSSPRTLAFTLNGAEQGAQSFGSYLTTGDTTWYKADNGTAWESGLATMQSDGKLARTTIYASSNSDLVVDLEGTVDVACDLPAFVCDTLNLAEITVTSAATFNIGAVQGLRILASGTTGPITSFGTTPNKLRIVRWAGSVLTHNATTLILLGGKSRTTATGDIGIYASDASGNWRELSYSPAAGRVVTVKKQVFTATGTYTPSTGMLYCLIELAGGGGGGGAGVGAVGQIYSGGGGGSGGYSRLLATAATIGASQAVTIGAAGAGGASGSNNGVAGGDTSVGSICIGKGGSGGLYGSAGQVPLGGNGGVAGTGDLIPAGAAGLPGFYNGVNVAIAFPSGPGGSSFFGGGARGVNASTSAVAGVTAGNYGGGGSGAATNNIAANEAGGNGSAGVVWITEYCSQ